MGFPCFKQKILHTKKTLILYGGLNGGVLMGNANIWPMIWDSGRLLCTPLQLSQFPQTIDH
jgi:hypothetical protein